MTDVQKALQEIESKCGFTTCPHFNFTDGRLLRMLDPRVCVCFGNDNRLRSQKEHDSKDTASTQIRTSCRKEAIQKRTSYGNQFEAVFHGGYNHSMLCEFCDTEYLLIRYGRHVFLRRNTSADLTSWGGTAYWYLQLMSALEASCCTPERDEETKHLTWCDEKDCRNGKT